MTPLKRMHGISFGIGLSPKYHHTEPKVNSPSQGTQRRPFPVFPFRALPPSTSTAPRWLNHPRLPTTTVHSEEKGTSDGDTDARSASAR